MQVVDVIIIGGGLSGLYAATLLQKQGISYRLFEAGSYLGGRLLSSPANTNKVSVDLGATWFWPHHHRVRLLLNALNINSFPQYTNGDALYQMSTDTPPQRITGTPGLSYRVKGGAAAIPAQLATRLNTQYINQQQPITRFSKVQKFWQIQTGNSTQPDLQASHLLLAAPPRVLLQRTNLADLLSAPLQQTLMQQQTWMAAQAKFVATYDTAFWREAGLAGDAFSRIGPMSEIHDASAKEDAGFALFGFLGIPADTRREITTDVLSHYCLQQLAQLFGKQALKPESYYLKDWTDNHWVCSKQDIGETLNHPAANLVPFETEFTELQLRFASTEVAAQEAGYIEGALLAAEQAVQSIVTTQ